MNSDELVAATLLAAFIPDTHKDYPSSVVMGELNKTLGNLFKKYVTVARAGYWRKVRDIPVTVNRARYRIPARSCAVEACEWVDPNGRASPMTEATRAEIPGLMGDSTSGRNVPNEYTVEGDQIVVLPKPIAAGYLLRVHYYIRPSRLVPQQESAGSSGVDTVTSGGDPVTSGGDPVVSGDIIVGTGRGQIIGIDTVLRQLTVNSIPFDETLTTPAAITSGAQKIDVVHPNGWHELSLVSAPQTIAGNVITVGGTDSLDDVELGDYVRSENQTDWPPLEDEWHQTLADATAVRLMMQRGDMNKAAALARKIGLSEQGEKMPGTDIARFQEILEPRVKNSPKVIVRRTGIIHGQRPYWGRV